MLCMPGGQTDLVQIPVEIELEQRLQRVTHEIGLDRAALVRLAVALTLPEIEGLETGHDLSSDPATRASSNGIPTAPTD
jgi:hypothetical protein